MNRKGRKGFAKNRKGWEKFNRGDAKAQSSFLPQTANAIVFLPQTGADTSQASAEAGEV